MWFPCGSLVGAGDQIAGMLAVAVASSRTLEVLDLDKNKISNFPSLRRLPTLQLLSYDHNPVEGPPRVGEEVTLVGEGAAEAMQEREDKKERRRRAKEEAAEQLALAEEEERVIHGILKNSGASPGRVANEADGDGDAAADGEEAPEEEEEVEEEEEESSPSERAGMEYDSTGLEYDEEGVEYETEELICEAEGLEYEGDALEYNRGRMDYEYEEREEVEGTGRQNGGR